MTVSRPATVVVLAAGAGTRMKSQVPKVLHPSCGVSMLDHVLAAARQLDPAVTDRQVELERHAGPNRGRRGQTGEVTEIGRGPLLQVNEAVVGPSAQVREAE